MLVPLSMTYERVYFIKKTHAVYDFKRGIKYAFRKNDKMILIA